MREYDVYRYGGYEVKYHKNGDYYPGYHTFVGYATKAYALQGIKEFPGYVINIWEYPGNMLDGREITIADLEEPEKEKKKKKKKKKKKEIGWIQD